MFESASHTRWRLILGRDGSQASEHSSPLGWTWFAFADHCSVTKHLLDHFEGCKFVRTKHSLLQVRVKSIGVMALVSVECVDNA